MKPNKIRLNLLIILIPLTILSLAGGYFAYTTWYQYANISELQNRLNKIGLLQSLEETISQEVICTTRTSGEKRTLKDQCKESRMATDAIVQELAQQSNKLEFYQKVNSLFSDKNQTTEIQSKNLMFGKVGLANTIQSIRYNVDTSQKFKIHTLINGEYHKKILNPIKSYLDGIGKYSDMSNKPFIEFFIDINNLYMHSVTETIFGTYFITNKKNFTPVDLMQWDDYMALAIVPDIDNYTAISPIKESLSKIFSSENSEQIVDKIDRMGIDILLGYATGQYEIKEEDWIAVNKKKQDLFMLAESETLNYLAQKNQSLIKNYQMIMIGGISISLLSILFFIVAAINYSKRIKEEDAALSKMMHEIGILTTESKREVLSSESLLGDLSNKKQIYIYISSILKLLHEKELQAGEANNAKDLFLANMSHEIRTPLNGIVGFTQLLKESSLTDDQREFINIIENSSDNLLTIVNDILDLSKITADKMQLEEVSFDIFDRASSAIETFSAKADASGINLGIFVDPTLPQYFIGDPAKLTQVLINLISNALKFTPKDGSINLFVERVQDEEESDEFAIIRFAIKDSGIGIGKEQKDKIFQAFTQADSSTSRKFGGTGLGLTISQAIIEYMGGKLDVISEEGEGAEFFFSIRMEKDLNSQPHNYPNYENLSIGLVVTDINKLEQTDLNLQTYIHHLGTEITLYSYTDLFDKSREIEIPNILFVDNSNVENLNELKVFSSIDTHLILITTGSFKNILDAGDHSFLKIIHKPMTLAKTIRAIESCISDGEVVTIPKEDTLKTDRFKNIRALVAEDNVINQKLILATLENFGLKVTLTSDGKEALEKRQSDDYDIIFMDIQMPIMNGMEATQAILEYEKEYDIPHIPIIALTANALKGDREKYIESGMDNYASKPLDLAELKNIIGTYFPEDSLDNQSENLLEESRDTEVHNEKIEPAIEPIIEPTETEPLKTENILEEFSEIEDTAKESESIDIDHITILLFNEMSLQSNIYRSVFKGLGYEVDIVLDENSFLDALENNKYTYAMYDASNFGDMACSVADIARDAKAIPIMFIEEDKERGFCTKTLKINSDRETIREMLENIS